VIELEVLVDNEKQTIALDLDDDVTAPVEKQSSRQAIPNLLDNAINYAPTEGTIAVRVQRDDRGLVVEIDDDRLKLDDGLGQRATFCGSPPVPAGPPQ